LLADPLALIPPKANSHYYLHGRTIAAGNRNASNIIAALNNLGTNGGGSGEIVDAIENLNDDVNEGFQGVQNGLGTNSVLHRDLTNGFSSLSNALWGRGIGTNSFGELSTTVGAAGDIVSSDYGGVSNAMVNQYGYSMSNGLTGAGSLNLDLASGSFAGSSGRGSSRALSRVPRAIATRGTPNGYTEINYTQMIRLYTNTSTGFWPTDQSTCTSYGGQGYSGLGFAFTPSNTRVTFGNSTTSTTFEDFAITDAAALGEIFDEVKMAKIRVEVWINTQSSNINNVLSNTPEQWMVVDTNDSTPPGLTGIQQYANSVRILPNKNTTMTFKPYLMADNMADDTGSALASGAMQQQGYVKSTTGAFHYGMKVWQWMPYEPDSGQVYFTQFRITFTRRFKRQK